MTRKSSKSAQLTAQLRELRRSHRQLTRIIGKTEDALRALSHAPAIKATSTSESDRSRLRSH